MGTESGGKSRKVGRDPTDVFADPITLAAHRDRQPVRSSLRAALTSTLPFLIGAMPPPAVEDTRYVRSHARPLWAFACVICLSASLGFASLHGAVNGAASEDALSTDGAFHKSSILSTQSSVIWGMLCGAPIAARCYAPSLSPFSMYHPASTATMAASGTAARESIETANVWCNFSGTMHGGMRAHLCLSKGHGLYGHEVTRRCPLFRVHPVLVCLYCVQPPLVSLIGAQPPPPEKVHCLWEPLPAPPSPTAPLPFLAVALCPTPTHPDAMLLCCDSALL